MNDESRPLERPPANLRREDGTSGLGLLTLAGFDGLLQLREWLVVAVDALDEPRGSDSCRVVLRALLEELDQAVKQERGR